MPHSMLLFFFMARQPPVGLGLPFVENSQSYSHTPHSVGLLWTSDQTNAETCTWQHTTPKRDRDINAHGGIRTRSLSKREAADPRFGPCTH